MSEMTQTTFIRLLNDVGEKLHGHPHWEALEAHEATLREKLAELGAENGRLLDMLREYAENDGHEYDGCEDVALADAPEDCRLCAVEKLIGRRS